MTTTVYVLFISGLALGLAVTIRWGAAGMLVGLAVPVAILLPPMGPIALVQVLIPGALIGEISHVLFARRERDLSPSVALRLVVAALAAWLVMSSFWTFDTSATLRALVLLASGGLGLWALQLFSRRVGPRTAWDAWLLVGLVQATTALLWQLSGRPDQFNLQPVTSPDLVFSASIRLGHPFIGLSSYYASFCLLFVIPATCWVGRRGLRAASGTANAIALVLTLSRGGVVAATAGAVIAILVSYRKSQRRIALLAATAASAMAAILYFSSPRGVGDAQIFSDPARLSLASLTFDFIRQRPIQGWGYGSYIALPGLSTGTHSYPLTVWLETGIIGLAAFAICNILLFWRLLKIVDPGSRGAAVGLYVAVWINMVVEASIEGVFFSLQLLCLIGLIIGFPARPRGIARVPMSGFVPKPETVV